MSVAASGKAKWAITRATRLGRLDIMTDYGDASVNAPMQAVETVADPAVPTRSAVIDVRLEDGSEIVQDQRMTAADYSYDRARTMDLVRRIAAEEGVPSAAHDRREALIMGLPGGSVKDIVGCFALLPRPLEDATAAS